MSEHPLPYEPAAVAPVPGGILVAHDGSESAQLALEWAGALAKRADYDLHVVRAWTLTTAPRPTSYEVGYMPPLQDWEMAVNAKLTDDVARANLDADLKTALHVVHGHAAHCLIASAAQADLLVVGSRGLGGFAGLVLGSVADQCVQHAPCPVTVVRHLPPGR